MGNTGAKIISAADWPTLSYLNLSTSVINIAENEIGNRGISWLVRANFLKLKELYIGYNKIDSKGIKQLTNVPWPIETLILPFNRID